MATNLVNYIGNLGKSVGYATVEKFKTMAPSTTEFVSSNAELYKNLYENIRDYRTTYRRGSDIIKKSKVYEAGRVGITAIFEDITSGKLYNKERQDAMDTKALGMDNNGEDGWGSFEMDDSSFDIGSDDDFGDFSEGEKGIVKSVEATSRSNANAVSMAIARTGEYVVESNQKQTNLLFTQNMQSFANLNGAVNTLNENVGKVLEFSNQVLKTHADNSQKYYEKTTELMQAQTALLTRIADNLSPVKEEKKGTEKIQYGDITGVSGTPDLSTYFKNVNKNLNNVIGQYLPNMNITGDENSNPFLSLVAQPLKFIPNYFVSKMIPDMVEKSIENFDSSLSGFFGSLMSKFNTMGKNAEGSPITRIIGKIFGISNSLKTDIDVSGYEKGKVDWDGKSKKALEEVIPTHLARIESLLSGKSEKRFDYDTGKFVTARDLKDKFDSEKKNFSKDASSDLKSLFDDYMENLTFKSKSEKENLEKDIEKIFDYMYKNNELFDVNNKDFDDLYSTYGVDSRNLRLFRAMFRQAPNSLKMQLSDNIMNNRQKQTALMEKYQKEGSIYSNLFNNLPIDEFVKYNKKTTEETPLGLLGKGSLLTELKDNLGHTIFYYLQNINKELSFIRKKGIGHSGDIVNNDEVTTIYANGREVLYGKPHKFSDEEIEDKSEESLSKKYADSKYRENQSFVKSEERRRKKNSSLFNVSEFNGEDKDYENRFKSILETKEVEKMIKKAQEKEKKKKDGFIDSLLSESTLGGKMSKFIEKGQSILNKPMDFIANIFNRADQRMYEMIYGTETGEEGFMEMFKRKTKETFANINSWIDENILEPMKKKLDIENFKDLGKKFFNLFGLDLDETGKNIKKYFFGDKDTNEKGLFGDIKDGFKDTFGSFGNSIKDAVKGTISDITKPFKENAKNKKKVFKEQAEDDEETSADNNVDSSYTYNNSKLQKTSDIIDNMYKSKYQSSGATEEDYESMFDLLNGEDFDYDSRIKSLKEQMKNNSKSFKQRKGEDTVHFLDNKGNKRYARKYLKEKKRILNQIESLKNKKENMKKTISDRYTYDDESMKFKDMLETIGIDTANMSVFDLETLRRRIPNIEEAGIDDLMNAVSGIDNIKGNSSIIQEYKDKALKSEATGNNKITLSEIQKFKYKKDEERKGPEYFIDEFKELIDKSKEDKEAEPVQIESRDYLKDIRDFLYGLRKPSKSRSSEITDPIVKPDRDLEEDGILREKAKGLSDVILKFLQGNTSQHAEGSNVLKEAEVSTLKPGELVLNPDEVKSVSSLVDSLSKALGTAGNKLSDISSDNYKKFTKLKDKLGDRLDISDAEKFMSDKTKEKYGNVINLDQYRKVVDSMSKQYDIDNDLDENGLPKDPIQRALYNDVKPFVTLMGEEATSAFKSVKKSLFGVSSEDESERFSDMMSDIGDNISEYAPKAIPAAILGSGVSLVTGAIGGPLLGAAIGAGASLTMNSEKAQTWLFGEKIADERTGGVIPKSVVDAISKYVPDMSKYGITGTLAGLLTPLGPVGGLLVGSAAGFAKNNDSIQDALFGERGLFDDKQKEKIKKLLPRMGLGALVGATVGPFGLVGNALLGAGAGFMTTSNKFTEFFIGKYNEKTDRYENGILPALRESIVDPLRNFGDDMKTKFFEFLDNDIMEPLRRSFDPFKKDAKLMINGVGRLVGKSIDWIFEKSFGTPLSKLANSLTKKALGFGKFIAGKLVSTAKNVVAAPFQLVGKIGDLARNSQINNGEADFMTAEERLAFKGDRDYKYRKLDEFIAEGDNNLEGMESLSNSIRSFKDLNKSEKQKRKELAMETGDEIAKHFGYRDTSGIQKSFRDGDYDKIDSIVSKSAVKRKANLMNILKSCQSEYNRQMDKLMNKAEKSHWDEKAIKYKEVHIKDDIKRKYLKDLDSNTQKEILDKLKEDYDTKEKDRDEEYTSFEDMMKSKIKDNDDNTKQVTDYINGQKTKFDTFKTNKQNKEQVTQNLQKAMLERGLDIDLNDDVELDKVYNMLEKEIENLVMMREKSTNEDEDGNKINTEQKLDKWHQQVVDLFARAIDAINNIGKSSDEVTETKIGDTVEETISNIDKSEKEQKSEIIKSANENNTDNAVEKTINKMDENEKEQKDGIIKSAGIDINKEFMKEKLTLDRLELDKMYRNNNKDEKEQKGEVLEVAGMKNNNEVMEKILDKLNENNDEDEKGIVTKIDQGKVYQFVKEKNGDLSPNLSDSQTRLNLAQDEQERTERQGIFSKLTGLFNGKEKSAKDDEKKKETLWDKVKNFFSGGIGQFLPAIIGLVAGGSFLKNIISDSDFRDSVVDGAKSLLTNTLFPEFGDTEGNGKDAWTNSITSNGVVRDVLKGGKGLEKISAKTAMKATDIFHPIKGAGKLGVHATSKVGSILGKGVSKVTGAIDNTSVLKKARDKISKNVAKWTNPFVKDVTKNVAEAAEKGAAGELGQKLSKFLYDLFSNSAVKKLVGDNAEEIAQKFVPKFVEKITKKAAENSAKVASRLAALATTGGLLNIAFFVGDFISGYRDAKNILGVTEEDIQELGFLYKIGAGILKAVNGAFIITSFVPEEFYVTAIFDYLAPAIGISDTDLQQRRKSTEEEVKAYNDENGTDLNVREYNKVQDDKRPGIIQRAKNWVGEKVDNAKAWFDTTSLGKKVSEITSTDKWKEGSEKFDKVLSYVVPSRLFREHIFKKDEEESNDENEDNNNEENNGEGGPIADKPVFGSSDESEDSEIPITKFERNSEAIENTNKYTIFDELKSKFGSNQTQTMVDDNSILITNVVNNIKNVCMGILNSSIVQTLIGSDKAQELSEKFIPALEDFLVTNMKSISNNKVLSTLLNAGVFGIFTAIQDFITGYNNAQNILGLDSEPTTGLKVCAGISNVFSRFISLGIIAYKKWSELITSTIVPIFSSVDKTIMTTREKITDNISQNISNEETSQFINQNKSVANSGTSIIQKARETATNFYNSMKEKTLTVWRDTKQRVANSYNYAKDTIKNFASSLGFGGPKENDWSNFDLLEKPKKIKSNTQEIYDGMGGELWGYTTGTDQISDAVKALRPTVEKYANQYGIGDKVDLLLAQIMQEAGGEPDALANDPMQSAEGHEMAAGSLHDQDKSIQWGCEEFSNRLKDANGDIPLTLQSYNFGQGFINYVKNNGGKMTQDLVNSFSDEQAAKNGGGRYGDKNYVQNVLKFYDGDGNFSGSSGSSNSSSSSSSSGSMLSDLANLFKNSVGKIFGINLTGDSSSSGGNGGTAEYQNGTVDTSSLSGTAKTVVDAAASMIGCPYVWGGTGEPLTEATVNKYKGRDHDITSNDGANDNWKNWLGKPGFDCSGLMQYAYNKAGIDIGRDTNAQLASSNGTEISVSDVQPGDLVFFGSRSNNHHVGMAIGNGKMIEAPSSGKTIRVSDIRKDAFAAKRFIKDGQGGLLEKYSKKMKVFKAENDIANNAIGGPVDTYFSKSLNGNVTSKFGFRNTRGSIGRNHTGIDIGAKQGTDIKTPIGGVVTKKVSSDKSNGYGNLVVMKDNQGAEHYFGHMENPTNLKPGDTVKPGQKIGVVGSTGNSTGSHLHYEVKQGGISVDPNKYYKNKGIGGENENTNTSSVSNTTSLVNADLLKSIITILSKIAQNTVSISDIFSLLQNKNTTQSTNTNEKSEAKTNTANITLKANKTKDDTVNLLKVLMNKNTKNDLGQQDLLTLLTALAQQ